VDFVNSDLGPVLPGGGIIKKWRRNLKQPETARNRFAGSVEVRASSVERNTISPPSGIRISQPTIIAIGRLRLGQWAVRLWE
jgi:hypothetical protein